MSDGENTRLDTGEERRGDERGGGGAKRKSDNEDHNPQNYKQQSTIKHDGTGLSLRLPTASGTRGGSTSGDTEHSTRDDENISNNAQQPAQTDLQKRCTRILDETRRSTGYYLSDVINCESHEEAIKVADVLQRQCELFKRSIVLISIDESHIHVIHDCAMSNKTCRCAFFKKTEIICGVRRRNRSSGGRPYINTLGSTDLQNILKYFCLSQRKTIYLKVGGSVERLPLQDSSVEKQGPEGCVSTGLAEQESPSEKNDSIQLFGEEPPDGRSFERNRRGREAVARKKERYMAGKQIRRMDQMMHMLQTYPMSPIDGILGHPLWLLDETLQYANGADNEVRSVLGNWGKQLCTWNIEDFNYMYKQPECKPIFAAGYNDIDKTYYPVDQSVLVLEELLNFQNGGDPEYIHRFLSDVFNVLERKVPKLNTIMIRAPPSSGKNYFFDCIKNYYLNHGQISKLNKWENFPLQEMESRRIVMFNEPNYSEEWIDTLKMVLGGDDLRVKVKHRAESPVYRTPVIILTNRQISIEKHPAFIDRIRTYHWNTASYLRDYDLRPHPLATYELFKKYGFV